MEIFEEEEKTKNRSTKILLVINLIIWGIILFMVVLWNGVVNAQTQVGADYWAWINSNNNWTTLNNGNTESGANTNQINIGWNNQTGNINGVIYFEAIGTLDNTAKINVVLRTEPTQTSSGVITKSCTIENYNIVYKKTKCQINFTIANNNQPYIRAVIKFDTNHLFDSITVSGYANVEPNNGATTEDITNQTIQIINNAIQNALQQSETIINESNSLGNRIETIINSATNSIQNSLMHCNSVIYKNAEITWTNGYLTEQGTIDSNATGYKTTDYLRVSQGTWTKSYTSSIRNKFYDENKQPITTSGLDDSGLGNSSGTFNVPSNVFYVRFTTGTGDNAFTLKGNLCQSNTDAIIENQNQNTSYILQYMNQNKAELEAIYTGQNADRTKLDDLEDIEDNLNNYTNIDLDDFEISIDTNTNNWVWNTLTSILNTSSLVFGFVISILSIGLIKLILNR